MELVLCEDMADKLVDSAYELEDICQVCVEHNAVVEGTEVADIAEVQENAIADMEDIVDILVADVVALGIRDPD